MKDDLSDRYSGSLLGLACGDAVGTSVEFCPRGTFSPLVDMVGGGPFNLVPGQWTDDTSMALCLAESLLAKNGFNAKDQMGRYLNWWQWGYMSSTGQCFDIGNTVRQALLKYQQTNQPFAGSVEPDTAGNGSLMRLAPVVLFYYSSDQDIAQFTVASSCTTHSAPEATECCRLLGELLAKALAGKSKTEILSPSRTSFIEPKVRNIASGKYMHKTREQIAGTGYSVASLEAALWCFWRSESFESAVLDAANLGDDADTTAAIVGQLAGAFYGKSGMPTHWLAKLHMRAEIEDMADALLQAAKARQA
ncbi:ADP-ribosylglycohydrolase family protein [Pseudomonas sp. 8BK]|uniref:ADP-ribosylglycohydrolase family protein n=1 Tax=Pseudomonas sp. 8BK TaxID=2653164 RepID=UPI00135A1D3C|nr:ADP-ribosylglycohydrolase family protein [Pseudomonas sp. 8BK]